MSDNVSTRRPYMSMNRPCRKGCIFSARSPPERGETSTGNPVRALTIHEGANVSPAQKRVLRAYQHPTQTFHLRQAKKRRKGLTSSSRTPTLYTPSATGPSHPRLLPRDASPRQGRLRPSVRGAHRGTRGRRRRGSTLVRPTGPYVSVGNPEEEGKTLRLLCAGTRHPDGSPERAVSDIPGGKCTAESVRCSLGSHAPTC